MAFYLPGQTICSAEGFIRGHGTSLASNMIKSTYFGTAKQINKLMTVNPAFAYKYAPEIGDVVIGRVVQIANRKWRLDTNSRAETSLGLSAINLPGVMQRRKSEADEMNMRSFFDINDLVVCEVQKVSKSGNAALHTRNEKYRRLGDGVLVEAPPFLVVPLRTRFLCSGLVEMIVGCNGYIWISTSSDSPEDLHRVGMLYKTIRDAAARQVRINAEMLMAEP
jgi:exosome complex component RRP4